MAGGLQSAKRLLDSTFNFINSESTEINTSTISGQIEAYTKCASVQSAISLKASLHSTLKIAAINDSGRWLGGNQGTDIEKRTIAEDMKLINFFNPHQSYSTFNHQLKTTMHVFGFAYIQKQPIVGFKNKFHYYILPTELVTPVFGNKISYNQFYQPIPDKYVISLYNGQIELQNDEVFIIYDSLLGFSRNNNVLSRLVSLQEPISAILSANQMFTQLIADGGARGIIGLGAKDAEMSIMLDDETFSVQKSLKEYGKLRTQLKYIVTKGSSNYTPLTSSILDMQLPENLLSKKIDIWSGFGIPNAFVVNEARFQVVPEARKEVFVSSVTPEGKCINEDLLRMKQMTERAWKYIADDSHHDFYQKSLKESSIAFQQASGALIPLVENNLVSRQQASDYLDPYLR